MTAQPSTEARPTRPPRAGSATSPQRPDGTLKVTGEFAYGSDLWTDDMLWGVTLRSPHPYARILRVDITEALTTPGVFAVLTADDVPGRSLRPRAPTSRCSRSTWSATRASRSRWSPPTTPRSPAGRRSGSWSTTRCSSRSPTRRPRWTPRPARGCTPAATWCGTSRSARGDPDADRRRGRHRRLRGRHAGPGVPRPGVRARGARGDGGVDLYVATQWLHVDQRQICCGPRARPGARCG